MNNQDKIKVVVGIVTFSVLIYLYVIEFRYFTNTIDFSTLVIYSFIVGLILSSFFIIKLMGDMALFEKFMLAVASLVLLGMLMPLLSSLSNRLLGQRTTQIKSFELVELEARSEQPYGILDSALVQVDGHLAKVQLADGMATFYLKKDLKYDHSADSIFLPMRRGFWGFNYIDLQSR